MEIRDFAGKKLEDFAFHVEQIECPTRHKTLFRNCAIEHCTLRETGEAVPLWILYDLKQMSMESYDDRLITIEQHLENRQERMREQMSAIIKRANELVANETGDPAIFEDEDYTAEIERIADEWDDAVQQQNSLFAARVTD
jgi:hypothetical protein